MRLPVLLSAIVVFLAGCSAPTTPEPTTSTTMAAAGTCGITLDELPGHAEVGTHSIVVTPDCDFEWSSQHVAAHYATTSTDTPSLQHYTTACTPVSGSYADDEILVDCAFTTQGTYYLRGHSIIMNGGQAQHYWTEEFIVKVVPAQPAPTTGVDVSVWNMPSNVQANETFTFHLVVTSTEPRSSDHMGAHFANASSPTGSITHYAAACNHVAGNVSGEFDITCSFPEPGTYYLRGHARFGTTGAFEHNWALETQIVSRA